jgi:DNA polymerase I
VGPKGAVERLARYATLEEAIAAGRFASQAERLLLYKRIATMDAGAPLPSVAKQKPTWDKASALAREWDLKKLAERLEGLGG